MEWNRVMSYIRRHKPNYEYDFNHFQLIDDGKKTLRWKIKDLEEPTLEVLESITETELNEFTKMKKSFVKVCVVEDLKYLYYGEVGSLAICNNKLHYYDGTTWIKL